MATKLATTKIEEINIFENDRSMKIGTFGHTIANYIVREFNKKRNAHKERSPERIKATIVKRGRGHRNIHVRVGCNDYYALDSNSQDLPTDYAPFLALYLRCNGDIFEQQKAKKYVKDVLETIKFLV